MKRLQTLAFLMLLPGVVSAEGMITGVRVPKNGWPAGFFPKSGIRMDAAFDCEFKSAIEKTVNFDSVIYCRWTNVGEKKLKFLLKDHDDYCGTLDYPWGLEVRVTSTVGKVITENSMIKDGWWSCSVLQSQYSEVRPGDAIFLEPGETVVRLVPLGKVLMGAADGRLPSEGKFSIEVRLGDILAAKLLTLHVDKKKKANKSP